MISLNLSYFPNWYSMFLFPKYIKFLDFHLGSVFFRTNLCDMYSQFAWRMRPRNLIPQATGTGGTWGWLKGLQLVDDDLVGGLEHDLYNFPYIGNSNPNWLSYFSEGFKPPTSIWYIHPHKLSHIYDVWGMIFICHGADGILDLRGWTTQRGAIWTWKL